MQMRAIHKKRKHGGGSPGRRPRGGSPGPAPPARSAPRQQRPSSASRWAPLPSGPARAAPRGPERRVWGAHGKVRRLC